MSNPSNLAALSTAVEALEDVLQMGNGLPSPAAAWTEDSAEFKNLARRSRAAFHAAAGEDVTVGDFSW